MANLYGSICTCTRCNGIVHTIRRGDTLYLLSRHYNVSVNDIMNANRNVNIYNLRIGDELCIPVRRVVNGRTAAEAEQDMMNQQEIKMNNNLNPMSATDEMSEYVQTSAEADYSQQESDDNVEELQGLYEMNITNENNMNDSKDKDRDMMKRKKLSEILDMDMSLEDFVKMLKEID